MQKISLTLSICSLNGFLYGEQKVILIAFYCNIEVERRDIYHVCLVIRQHLILNIIFSFSGGVVLTRKALNPSSFLSLNINFFSLLFVDQYTPLLPYNDMKKIFLLSLLLFFLILATS